MLVGYLHMDFVNWPNFEFKCPKLKWMKQGKKLFCPYNIILVVQSEKRREGTFQIVKVMI
jgi:hypothetical protein